MHLLVIAKVWPEPASSAAGSRLLEIISLFQNSGWQISIASTAKKNQYSFELDQKQISSYSIALNDSSFDSFILQIHPEVVLFDRFMTEEQFGWRVAEHLPGALRILDMEDLHGLRDARHTALKKAKLFETNDLNTIVTKREIASVYRCDLSLVISNYEMHLLHEFFKVDESLIFYLPFIINELSDAVKDQNPSFIEREGFISIGNFLHEPNLDAVKYLKEDIWPLIRMRLPKATISIYGAYTPSKVLRWHDPDNGFLIKGRAENADTVMQQSRVCLAPLRFGAGLKGKLIIAMANGTVNVTTSIGAEGMRGGLEWGGAIKDTAIEFADAAVQLYSQKSEWNQAQLNGYKILNENFNRSNFESAFMTKIYQTLNQLESHRLNNFTGIMLQHHYFQSNKYMSLWIEEKNKSNQ